MWGAIKWWTIEAISLGLVSIELSSEIHRKLRKLDDLKFWKASEYRYFLHYAAPVNLRGRISQDEYNHHMLFIGAVKFLSSYTKVIGKLRVNYLNDLLSTMTKLRGRVRY